VIVLADGTRVIIEHPVKRAKAAPAKPKKPAAPKKKSS
jgi:hypothetical protein